MKKVAANNRTDC